MCGPLSLVLREEREEEEEEGLLISIDISFFTTASLLDLLDAAQISTSKQSGLMQFSLFVVTHCALQILVIPWGTTPLTLDPVTAST